MLNNKQALVLRPASRVIVALLLAMALCCAVVPLVPKSAHAETTYNTYARGIQRLVMGYTDGNGQEHTWNESVRAVDEDADGVNISNVAYCADLWTSPPPVGEVRRGNLLELYSQDKITKMALINVFVDQHADIFYDDTYDESFRLFFRQMAYWKIQNMDNGRLQDTFIKDSERFGKTRAEIDALYEQALAFITDPNNLARYVGHGYAYYGPAGTQNLMKVWYEQKPGIEIEKTIAGGKSLPGQSIAGAEYSVYEDQGLTRKVETIVIGTNGKGQSSKYYDEGTYYVKETKAPAHFTLDPTVHTLAVTTGKNTASVKLNVQDYPQGKISVHKVSAVPATTDGNPCYSLEGTTFDVYEDAGLSRRATTITVNAEGNGESGFLDAVEGTKVGKKYYVREQQNARGKNYAWNSTAYEVTVQPGTIEQAGPGKKDIPNAPQTDKISVFLRKIDIETGMPVAQGDASLAGAQFKVEYFANETGSTSGAPARTWVFTTDESGSIDLQNAQASGDALYKSSDGKSNVFPVGTYRITEVKAPTGYLLPAVDRHGDNDGPWVVQVKGDGSATSETISTFNGGDEPVVQAEQVIRGDIELVKVEEGSMKRLACTPFILKSNTTGEMHVVVTDENGCLSTAADWNPHTERTNANDPVGANGGKFDENSNGAIAIGEDGSWYVADESKLDMTSGVWFGLDSEGNWTQEVVDEAGALYYDASYELIELSCSANEGLKLVDIHNVAVRRDGREANMGTIDDAQGPSIRTQAHDAKTSSQVGSLDEECTLVDNVSYEGLDEGVEYTLSGTLMDAATGEPLLVDGEPCAGSTTFTPRSSFGTVDVEFHLDASSLQGVKTVVFEQLSVTEAGTVVARHEDIEDEGQSIEFPPEAKTNATDAADGDHSVIPSGTQKIVDVVSYRGLKPGVEYVVTGTLMDKQTKAPVLAPDGTSITGETTFTPEEPDGTVEVVVEFDASLLAGKTTVMFEDVTQDGKTVCVHADINDEAQTLRFPQIGTAASDKADGDSFVKENNDACVVDTVAYGGLEPGAKYRLEATLMDVEAEEPLEVGGKGVQGVLEFTPEETSGHVKVEIPVDTSSLAGKRIVVFERLVALGDEEKLVAEHADIDNEAQTVAVPSIGTKATDKADGDKTIAPDSEVTVIDVVSYEGLMPGRTYTVQGVLMDKSTGKALVVDGRRVTASADFKPDAPRGSVDLTFTFSTKGIKTRTELVAFETVFFDGKEVATHCDLKDAAQTVKVGEKPTASKTPLRKSPRSGAIPKTGDEARAFLAIVFVFSAMGGIALAFGLHQKRRASTKRRD